ncbi:MAG: hypothetical protein EBU57_02065, partial [Alphaproteobacteria bacterium]|nr:hypothetical protein [Alphaproteobacteria bacterium]
VFLGMVVVGVAGTALRLLTLRAWVVIGCIGSAAALLGISMLGQIGPAAPLLPAVIGLGFFNGMFAVAAIGSMMALAGEGRDAREGTRMGLWGAAQAIAAGFGGLAGQLVLGKAGAEDEQGTGSRCTRQQIDKPFQRQGEAGKAPRGARNNGDQNRIADHARQRRQRDFGDALLVAAAARDLDKDDRRRQQDQRIECDHGGDRAKRRVAEGENDQG